MGGFLILLLYFLNPNLIYYIVVSHGKKKMVAYLLIQLNFLVPLIELGSLTLMHWVADLACILPKSFASSFHCQINIFGTHFCSPHVSFWSTCKEYFLTEVYLEMRNPINVTKLISRSSLSVFFFFQV